MFASTNNTIILYRLKWKNLATLGYYKLSHKDIHTYQFWNVHFFETNLLALGTQTNQMVEFSIEEENLLDHTKRF